MEIGSFDVLESGLIKSFENLNREINSCRKILKLVFILFEKVGYLLNLVILCEPHSTLFDFLKLSIRRSWVADFHSVYFTEMCFLFILTWVEMSKALVNSYAASLLPTSMRRYVMPSNGISTTSAFAAFMDCWVSGFVADLNFVIKTCRKEIFMKLENFHKHD